MRVRKAPAEGMTRPATQFTGTSERAPRFPAGRSIEDLVRPLIETDGRPKPEAARMVPLRRLWWPR